VKCFIREEYNILPGSYDYVKLVVMLQTLFRELYEMNIDHVLTLMKEQQLVKQSTDPRAMYLDEIAYITARHATNPLLSDQRSKNRPLPWETFVKKAKSTCGFIPDSSGDKVVVRSSISVCNFGMGCKPNFCFEILNNCETFYSPESDIRKAYLLHKRVTS